MRRLFYTSLLFLCTYTFSQEPPGKAPSPLTTQDMAAPEPGVAIQGYQHAFLKMVIALVALILLIWLAVWALKRLARGRFGSHSNRNAIKIIERKPLSPKTVLYLIEVDGQEVLIAESQLEVRRLTTLLSEENQIGKE